MAREVANFGLNIHQAIEQTQRDHHRYLKIYMLVVSTQLKNISQIGSFPQVGAKMKKIYVKPPPSLMFYFSWQKGSMKD